MLFSLSVFFSLLASAAPVIYTAWLVSSLVFHGQPMSGWLSRLRLYCHDWTSVMQLGQPDWDLPH